MFEYILILCMGLFCEANFQQFATMQECLQQPVQIKFNLSTVASSARGCRQLPYDRVALVQDWSAQAIAFGKQSNRPRPPKNVIVASVGTAEAGVLDKR